MTQDKNKIDKSGSAAGAASKSRDSSLYRDIYKREQAARAAQDETDAGPSAAGAPIRNTDLLKKQVSSLKFVLTTTDPEVIPVEHQAVITELNSSLSSIETQRNELEAQLADKHSANKLQIAQLKGRLAALRRKKLEIEALLSSRHPDATTAANDAQSAQEDEA